MAKIGQWTRILVGLFGYPIYKMNPEKLSIFSKNFNKRFFSTSKLLFLDILIKKDIN